jgi:ribosome maturation factor RimP
MNTDLIDQIRTLVAPSLRQCGVELVGAQWSSGKRHGLLRLTIDRPGGVTLDDCERVSTAVSAVLDAYDPIANAYSLEVSSPGAERPISTAEEWQASLGRRVNVHYTQGAGETIVEGRLMAVSPENVELEVRVSRNREAPVTVPLGDVISAKIVVDI